MYLNKFKMAAATKWRIQYFVAKPFIVLNERASLVEYSMKNKIQGGRHNIFF